MKANNKRLTTPPGSPRKSVMRSPQHVKAKAMGSPPLSPSRSPASCDRFIPRRSLDMSVAHYLTNENTDEGIQSPAATRPPHSELERALRAALLTNNNSPTMRSPLGHATAHQTGSFSAHRHSSGPRVLNFSDGDDNDAESSVSSLGFGSGNSPVNTAPISPKTTRSIPSAPSRILDAPDLVDDYYLNLISWSSTNILAVALGPSVYTWNADTNTVQLLCQLSNGDIVTSVSWMAKGSSSSSSSGSSSSSSALLAVGCNSSRVELWDAVAQKQVRTLGGHSARVASLSWNPTSRNVLTSGGRDSLIINHGVSFFSHVVKVAKIEARAMLVVVCSNFQRSHPNS